MKLKGFPFLLIILIVSLSCSERREDTSQVSTESRRTFSATNQEGDSVAPVFEIPVLERRIAPDTLFKPRKTTIADRQGHQGPLVESVRFERLSSEDGLPSNSLRGLHVDSEGFLWIAYGNGIIRYDGYDFVYLDEIGVWTPGGLAIVIHEDGNGDLWFPGADSNSDIVLYKRQNGVAYRLDLEPINEGFLGWNILRIDEEAGGQKVILRGDTAFYFFNHADLVLPTDTNYVALELIQPLVTSISIPEEYGKVWDFMIDNKNEIWFQSDNGLGHYDLNTQEFETFRLESDIPNKVDKPVQRMIEDTEGRLWLAGYDEVVSFHIESREFTRYPFPEMFRLQNRPIWSVLGEWDPRGVIWIQVFGYPSGSRLFWLDPATGNYALLDEHDQNPYHERNPIWAQEGDSVGNYWLATNGKLFKYNHDKSQFNFQKSGTGPDGLHGGGITALFEDSNNIIWIGTEEGILNRWDRTNNAFAHIRNNARDPRSLLPGLITAICRDATGTLWVGTENGLNRQNTDGTFTHYTHDPKSPNSLSSSWISVIFEDSKQNLWVGVRGLGGTTSSTLYHYDSQCDCFERQLGDADNWVTKIVEDKESILWLILRNRHYNDLSSYNPVTEELIVHPRLGNQALFDIHVDQAGSVWHAWYNQRLIKYNPDSGVFSRYDIYGLFPSNPISTILEDGAGKLWIVCAKGLIHFDPVEETALNLYSPQNWMPAGVPWSGEPWTSITKAIKTINGDFIIGTKGGILSFNPRDIEINRQAPQAAITGITAGGNPVNMLEESSLKHRAFRGEITLPYYQNDLSIDYAGLHFKEPSRNLHAYQLDGWDDDWVHVGAQRTAKYSNLSPGAYTFRVKAANSDGVWMRDADAVSIAITILPPWWLTWWAYTFYSLFVVGSLIGFYKWRTGVHKKRVAEVEQINTKLTQLDKLKDQFLANTSHELRTPLSGIIGIAESLEDGIAGKMSKKALNNLGLIISSSKRLANLVNDILDFSKLKNQDLVLQLRPVDMHSAVDVVFTISEPIIQNKELRLINNISRDVPLVEADENRVQQILHNLVGNAIKFTEKGSITIDANAENGFLEIGVSDTGIGIPKEKFGSIFKSFEQAEGGTAREYGGTGLGLSVTRQLVELHGGSISVDSEVDKGTTFRFTLPIGKEKREDLPDMAFKKGTESSVTEVETDEAHEEAAVDTDATVPPQDKGHILIVDDEPVNLQVLENHLSLSGYEVTKAGSGHEALGIIKASEPFDLIILDIMMPKMSGYEVCHQLRDIYLPSELPVVMLTAKNRVTDLVEGFSVGANDYLTKPFSKDELLSRIKTHLNLHRIHRSTGKFVPFEFLRAIGRESITEVQLGDHTEKEVTIFFSDIRDFTALSEKMSPEENFQFINNYVGVVGPIVRKHEGFINQYQGDGIMAIFPKELDQALKAAIEMQGKIQEFNKEERQHIAVGMGLHMGPLVMGIIGDEHRNDPATIADTVNAASRMESLTKHYGANIIVTDNCIKSLKNNDNFHFRYLGNVQVKGKQQAIKAFECFDGDMPKVKEQKLRDLDLFQEGMDNFYAREFASASAIFDKVLKSNKEDLVAQYFRTKAAEYTISGVPDDWDGIERMESK